MNALPANPNGVEPIAALAEFVSAHRCLLVLTGAGCSTDSGIPDYRDGNGRWKRSQPVLYQQFVRDRCARQRYWARGMLGWRHFRDAQPNATHRALADLETAGYVHQLVTQNVDGLHQRAGSRQVIDLHGRLDTVTCLDCGDRFPRAALQESLERLNPEFVALAATVLPDGDAALEDAEFSQFEIPPCTRCGGVLKPDVVFFGESVPGIRVDRVFTALREATAVLVVGSSLAVYSAYRFCLAADRAGQAIAAVNLGHTRADDQLSLKIAASCGEVLPALAQRLGPAVA